MNTRLEAGFVRVKAPLLGGLLLACLCCTSLQDLSSYSEGSAGGAGLPLFQAPTAEAADEPRPDAGASITAASEVQNPANVALIPAATAADEDDCTADGEFTSADSATCYAILAEVGSWRSGREGCQEWGGDLAQVGSAEENALLSDQSDEDVWLGASDFDDEGTFRWLDGDEVDAVDADGSWGPGQPDNYLDREDCVELRAFDDSWNDVPCMSGKRGLCERALEGLSAQ